MACFRRLLLPLLAVALASAGRLFAEQTQGSFERTLNVSGQVDLDVSTGSGAIDIHVAGGNTVSVKAKISAANGEGWLSGWLGGSADIEERIKRIEQNPPVEQHGNTIRIGYLSDSLQHNISISYDIAVPQHTRVASRSGSGSQRIRGVAGPARASSGSGSLHLFDIGSEVEARAGSGSIELSSIKGSANVETGSGHIEALGIGGGFTSRSGSGGVRLEQATPGSVRIRVGSGSVEARNVNGSLDVHAGSGSVNVQGALGGEWQIHTGSGGVDLRLPQSANFDLRAHTGSGRVNIDRPLTAEGSNSNSNSNDRHEVNGKVGSGGVVVDVSTGSGTIHVS